MSRPLVGTRSSATSCSSSCFLFRSCRPHFFCQARSQNCHRRLLASPCLPACLSVRMEQLGSHWTNFHDICFFFFFRNSVEEILLIGTTAQFNTVAALMHISQLSIFVGLSFQCLILHLLICVFTQFHKEKIQVSLKSGKNNGYFT